MFLKKFIALLMLLILALPVAAQDQAESAATETTIGPITLTLPEAWSAIGSQDGRIIIASVDLQAFSDASQLPDDVIVTQIQLIGKQRINGLSDDASAADILMLMTQAAAEQTEADATLVETRAGETYDFALTDVSTEATNAKAIVFMVSDETFALATATTLNAETSALDDNEDIIFAMFDTALLDIETPFLDGENIYADLPQSVNDAGFAQLGNPDAPVELIEIGSFDCPACAQFHAQVFPELLPRIQAGELVVTYVPIYGTGSLPNGDSAARASICALGTDAYWQWHGVLYEWQSLGTFAFMYERLQNGAEQLGIDPEAFAECFASDETTELLIDAFGEVELLGDTFTGTPGLLVNGTLVPNSLTQLNAAIDSALAAVETE